LDKDKIISELIRKVELLVKRVEQLEVFEKENKKLRKENTLLRKRLSKYEHPKNSTNSSIPPSKDENRLKHTSSLRKPTGKNPGGQLGHEGKTLEMTSTPDKIIELKPDYCKCCGGSLHEMLAEKEESRQILDIPTVKAVFTEYQTFSKKCNCGHKTISDFPEKVKSAISYGENIEGLVGYFHARQYIPFARMQEMFHDVFNINISEGGIHCLLNRLADKVDPIYEMIKDRVQNSKVIGTDETGAKVNGKKHWFWTWQTPNCTFIAHSDNRGKDTINTHFPLGFPNSTLVHDAWRAQLNTTAKLHQSCLSHLQRNLKYLNELYQKNQWGNQLLKLLYDSLDLKRNMSLQDYSNENHQRKKIIERFEKLLLEPPDKKHKDLYTFYKRMLRDKDHIFTFLFVPEVPSDNNASERAIRNIKVKQKISGQFKIEKSAQNFAKIRSVIDTTLKNGLNVLEGLSNISKFGLRIQPTD